MINGNVRLQGWMHERKFGRRVFFLAKVQSERRGTRVLAKSSIHGGRAHCLIRSLFDTTNISRNNK